MSAYSGLVKKIEPYIVSLIGLFVPTGVVWDFAGDESNVPKGFLICAGQEVRRDKYPKLFATIGTIGGTPSSPEVFKIPDCRGRVAIGKDDMSGVAANRITSASTNGANSTILGGAGGTETHTLTTSQIPAHTHSLIWTSVAENIASGSDLQRTYAKDTGSSNTGSTGGGGGHSNTQPWMAFNKIIKAL